MANSTRETVDDGSVVRGRRILVIEDDLFFQEYVHDLLAKGGAEVLRAQDGEAGLSLAVTSRPDLLLLDVEIPKLQGFELLRTLRSRPDTSSIPVVMMSGKVEKEVFDRHARTRARADGYLVKPFSDPELFAALREALGRVHAPAESGKKEAEASPGGAPRVLVVDDSAHIRGMVCDFLRESGAAVLEAADGKAGLAKAMEALPDAVLLDVQMPHLNGFVVCELLKKAPETHGIPIIIMSAVADEETFRKHSRLKNRADAYLLKPFKKADLLALLGRLTGHAVFLPQRSQERSDFVLPPSPPEPSPRPSGAPKAQPAPPPPPSRPSAPPAPPPPRPAPGQEDLFLTREKALREEAARASKERDRLREELEAQVAAGEERKRDLTEKLSRALRRLEEVTAASEKSGEEVRRLQKQLAAAEGSRKEAEGGATELHERIRALEMERDASIEELKNLKAEKAGMLAARRDLEAARASAQAEAQQARDASSRLQEKSSRLEADLASAKKAQTELEKVRQLADRETGLRADLEKRVKDLAAERDEARRGKDKGEAATSQAATRLEGLEKKLASAERESASLKKMAAAETSARMESESRLVSLTQERDVAIKEVAALRSRLEEAGKLRAKLDGLESEKMKLAADLASARESLAGVQGAVKEMESRETSRSETEQKAKAAFDREKAALKEELEVAGKRAAESEALGLRLKEREEVLKDTTALLQQEQAETRALKAALAKAREEAEKLAREHGLSEKERVAASDKLSREKAAAEKDSASLRERLAAAEKEKGEGAARVAALQEELAGSRKQMEKARSGLGETEKKALAREEELRKEQAGRKKAEEELAAARKAGEEGALRQASLERSLQTEKEKAAALQKESASLRERLAQEEKKGLDLSGALSGEERKGRELLLETEKGKAARAQLEGSLAETRKKLDETARSRDALEKSLADARQKIEEGVKVREAHDKSAAALRKTLDEGERARAALEKSLADEKSRHAATGEQVKKAQAEIEGLRKTVAAAGEKGGKLEAVLREQEGKARGVAAELDKEKIARTAAENALREARREAERAAAEREKREGALKGETARVAKEKAEVARKVEEAQAEGRKLAERLKAAEGEVAATGERERASAASLARMRGIIEAALPQAQGVLSAPGGHKEGLEALVRSLSASLAKEAPGEKGAWRPARAGAQGKVALVGGIAGGVLIGAALGAFVLSGLVGGGRTQPPPAAVAEGTPPTGGGSLDESPELIEYAKSWSRQTVEAAGEDIKVQATLHSAAEAELALKLLAKKERWAPAKLAEQVAEARKLWEGSEYLIATVLVKAGTSKAPSTSELEKRLQVKDPWGKMVAAVELPRAKGAGKLLLEAVRAPNPDYQEATGVTVAFPRRGLRLEAETLQLVLQPTGAEPGRMVTWDLSGWGG